MSNLQQAWRELKNVRVYDNSDLRAPYRLVAVKEDGQVMELRKPRPVWLRAVLPM